MNLDITDKWAPGEIVVRDICQGLPFCDSMVEEILAMDIIEHIPPWKMSKVALMNELHRVLVPGGTLKIRTPYPYSWKLKGSEGGVQEIQMVGGPGPWMDPTHHTVWVPESFDYFTGEHGGEYMHGLGITAQFQKLSLTCDHLNMAVTLAAVKPTVVDTYLSSLTTAH